MFEQAFKNNFYTTQHNAALLSNTSGLPFKQEGSGYTIKKKNIAITNKKPDNNKEYMIVLKEDNYKTKNPSFIEYAIFYKKTYDQAKKNYKRSFKDSLHQGKKYPHITEIKETLTKKELNEVYKYYKKQMREHNSFFFPKQYFEEFLKLKEGKVLILKYQEKLLAYCFFIENKNNIYDSLAGSIRNNFKYKASQKQYDELIQYACKKKKNIHFGLGEHNSGYQSQKLKVGCEIYKTKRHPNDEKILKLLVPLIKYKITGWMLGIISKLFPKKIIYLNIPFT